MVVLCANGWAANNSTRLLLMTVLDGVDLSSALYERTRPVRQKTVSHAALPVEPRGDLQNVCDSGTSRKATDPHWVEGKQR